MSTRESQNNEHSTWISLLDLLCWNEFFFSVDQTTLWRRHIAWAKPDGKDIREYTTKRFASNMVFLSLLLGTNMSVLFNSAVLNTEIRQSMMHQAYDLKMFIGICQILSACASVLGLVATFTAWGMIESISDCNAHCLLRSSMGEYVTSLPSRFVVASLYFFLLWLAFMIVEILSGPLLYVLVVALAYVFFQVVISLNAFGRLIIHTGAMGQKRVLDPDLERLLLPSGLHASLLIKATERSRRRVSVVTQYKQKQKRKDFERAGNSAQPSIMLFEGPSEDSRSDDDEEASFDFEKHGRLSARKGNAKGSHHRRDLSADSIDFVDPHERSIRLPRASVLNRAYIHEDLKGVVETTLSSRGSSILRDSVAYQQSRIPVQQEDMSLVNPVSEMNDEENVGEPYDADAPVRPGQDESTSYTFERIRVDDLLEEEDLVAHGNSEDQKDVGETTLPSRRTSISRKTVAFRQSQLLFQQGAVSIADALREWNDEEDVRELYNAEPPVDLVATSTAEDNRQPRANFLNRLRGPRSLFRKKTPRGPEGFDGCHLEHVEQDRLGTLEEHNDDASSLKKSSPSEMWKKDTYGAQESTSLNKNKKQSYDAMVNMI